MPNKFAWESDDFTVSQCVTCKHKSTTGATCTAFPNGIPEQILTNASDHTKPYPGDNGIRYERRTDV